MIRLTCLESGSVMIPKSNIKAILYNGDSGSRVVTQGDYSNFNVKETIDEIEDMILRDQFAMSAMNATISAGWDYQSNSDMSEDAYKMADAMLKQRKEK